MPKKLNPKKTMIFKVLVDGKPVELRGWQTTPALAIAPDGDKFASVMLLNGGILERGFASLHLADQFNRAVASEKKLFPGTPHLLEFYERAGGLGAAKAMIERIRKKVESLSQ